MNAKRLYEKDPGEVVSLTFDFTIDLDGADIIGTPVVTVTVDRSLRRNADPSPSALLNGAPQVSGKAVLQSIDGGIDGVDYKVACQIITDGTPPSTLRKTSILPVRAQ